MYVMRLETDQRYSSYSNAISEEKLIDCLSDILSGFTCLSNCPEFHIDVSFGTTVSDQSNETYFKLEIRYDSHNGYYTIDDVSFYLIIIRDKLHNNFMCLNRDACTCVFIDDSDNIF